MIKTWSLLVEDNAPHPHNTYVCPHEVLTTHDVEVFIEISLRVSRVGCPYKPSVVTKSSWVYQVVKPKCTTKLNPMLKLMDDKIRAF